MTAPTIAHQRLANQRLAANPFAQPAEVVQWLGAVQAQDYAAAKWALGLRLRAATDDSVEQAFADGMILRTHVLRPTWHFVAPADIHWLLALTAPRVQALNAPYYRKLELDENLFQRSASALVHALAGDRHLTRAEVRTVLEGVGIATTGEFRLSYLLMQAELVGLLCSGPRRGKQHTYALLDERVPLAQRFKPAEPAAELARRYCLSRSPATVQDFAKWSGLTITTANAGLEAVKSQLQHQMIAGQSYWCSPDLPTLDDQTPSAYLLSIYDEYISSYKDRSAMVEPSFSARLSALGNDLTAIIVLNGQIVGTWKRTRKKTAVAVTPTLFTSLTEAKSRALDRAIERYAAFLKLPVSLDIR